MSTIGINYDRSVEALRLADDASDPEKEAYETHIASIACHIQPLDDSFDSDIEGNYGKDSVMFCDHADLTEGDRIVDGGFTYQIVGVEKFFFLGQPRHMELRIRRFIK